MQLENRVAVITGGAQGIGYAIAERLLEEGARVFIVDIDEARAVAAARDLSALGPASAMRLDICDWPSVSTAFSQIAQEEGRFDICVTSAGVQEIGPSLEMSQDRWEKVISTNLTGLFGCAQAAARQMIAFDSGGAIVNIASASGFLGIPERAPYCTAKAGVISLTRVLGCEWATQGVRVNAVAPGWVGTRLVEAAIDSGQLSAEGIHRRTPMERLATPQEIANAVLYLASDSSSYITGTTLAVDGGFSSFGG